MRRELEQIYKDNLGERTKEAEKQQRNKDKRKRYGSKERKII